MQRSGPNKSTVGRLSSASKTEFCVNQTWDGKRLAEHEHVHLKLRFEAQAVELDVTSPFYGDDPPLQARGSTDRLWEHEVVEVFLLGDHLRYLEIELGPHGHYLVLELQGVRHVIRQGLPIQYQSKIDGRRWTGKATIPASYLPPGELRGNAYAIHGRGVERSYLAAIAVPGDRPDFHQPEVFVPLNQQS